MVKQPSVPIWRCAWLLHWAAARNLGCTCRRVMTCGTPSARSSVKWRKSHCSSTLRETERKCVKKSWQKSRMFPFHLRCHPSITTSHILRVLRLPLVLLVVVVSFGTTACDQEKSKK